MGYRRAYCGISILLSIISPVVAADEAPSGSDTTDAPAVTELTMQVSLPDGSPAVGVEVFEMTERGGVYGPIVGVTDLNGRFVIGFQREVRPRNAHPKGYGTYRWALLPDDYRWEVSDVHCWDEADPDGSLSGEPHPLGLWGHPNWFHPDYDGTLDDSDPSDNWSYGKGVPVFAGKPLTWNVQLRAGESVDVSVVDQFDAPVASAEIEVGVDLMARTRTGNGAKILQREVKTDEKGHFRLDRVGDYAYYFNVKGQPFYRPDHWCYVPEVNHNLLKQGPVVHFQRPVPHHLKFVALDAKSGAPIAGAALRCEMQFPAFQQGGPLGVSTGSDGVVVYDEPIELEHYVSFELEVPGYAPGRFDMKQYVPGEPMVIRLVRKTK